MCAISYVLVWQTHTYKRPLSFGGQCSQGNAHEGEHQAVMAVKANASEMRLFHFHVSKRKEIESRNEAPPLRAPPDLRPSPWPSLGLERALARSTGAELWQNDIVLPRCSAMPRSSKYATHQPLIDEKGKDFALDDDRGMLYPLEF